MKWKPIEPLSEGEKSIFSEEIVPIHSQWRQTRSAIQDSSKEALEAFHERLARRWSIETGILERVYDVDRGTTELLVERGFYPELIDRSASNREPESLVEILKDHQSAVTLTMDAIASKRPLTDGFIHQLHSVICRHQHTSKARDESGKDIELELLKGAYKKFPNNPTRQNGTFHEYCPPLQVPGEMENLLRWYHEYQDAGLDALVVSAWFHHRFTQIHPYQDGNGRLARLLANMILIKGEYLPIVIDRSERQEYLAALEAADAGDFAKLVRLFVGKEQAMISQAVSIDVQVPGEGVQEIAQSIAERIQKRAEKEPAASRDLLNALSSRLSDLCQTELATMSNPVFISLRDALDRGIEIEFGIHPHGSGVDNLNPFEPEITEITEGMLKTRANFSEDHRYVEVYLLPKNLPGFRFVVSFHHIGARYSGFMEAVAFVRFGKNEESLAPAGDPFVITAGERFQKLEKPFKDWLRGCFESALKKWRSKI